MDRPAAGRTGEDRRGLAKPEQEEHLSQGSSECTGAGPLRSQPVILGVTSYGKTHRTGKETSGFRASSRLQHLRPPCRGGFKPGLLLLQTLSSPALDMKRPTEGRLPLKDPVGLVLPTPQLSAVTHLQAQSNVHCSCQYPHHRGPQHGPGQVTERTGQKEALEKTVQGHAWPSRAQKMGWEPLLSCVSFPTNFNCGGHPRLPPIPTTACIGSGRQTRFR